MDIVICDDDPHIINELSLLINSVTIHDYPSAKIHTFSDGRELISWYIQDHSIDILFMDVELPGYNGIEVLKRIRALECNCITIFISFYSNYVFDTLEYSISQYLIKPFEKEKVTLEIHKALDQYKKNHYSIIIHMEDKHRVVSVKKIIIIESKLGYLYYFTEDGIFRTSGKIAAVADELKPYNFLRTHKSYIINMDKVIYYQKYKFYLTNELSAEIGRTRRAAIIKQFEKYIRKKNLI